MKKLIGPHVAGLWQQHLDILRRWQPPVVLVLSPEKDKVQQLKEACPQAVIIGRFFHDDSHYNSNINARPKEFAREIHQEIVNNPATPLLDFVQSNNETNQDWQGIQKLNIFTFEWMNLADISEAYKCAILAFSVGNPDLPNKPGDPAGFDGKMLYWQQVLESLRYAQDHDHVLLMHAYGYPNMFTDADWMIYRYERQVQGNLARMGVDHLKYVYGETGIDRLIVNGKGGYKVAPDTTDQGYVNQLLQWERDLQSQPLLLGGSIFTFGDSGGWDTYDITTTNAANMVADHYASHAGDYDTPDTRGNTVFIPIVTVPGEPVPPTPQPFPRPPLVWDERLTQRGIELTQYVPQPGDDGVWCIVQGEYMETKEHTFGITLDEDGQRKPGVEVRWWWKDGKEDKVTELKPNDPWMVDFAMFAHSKSYGLKVLSGPSDSVWGMGLGSVEQPDWNIHVSYRFTFQWVDIDETTVPAPAPPPVVPVRPTPRLKIGDTAYAGGYVNLRKTPGYVNKPAGDVVQTLPPGTKLKFASGPHTVNNLVWWGISDGLVGWVAENDPNGAVLLSTQPPVMTTGDVPTLIHPVHRPDLRRISQIFGVNEANYKQFIYDGVPLMGHNGVDFATPVGTTIVAVDDGVVMQVKDEGTAGFGRHLLIKHSWGESLYAHLSQVLVSQGQEVDEGDAIALSGNTGNSTGPHLHFGIRKNGYKRSDGWGGYTNPLPYIGPDVVNVKEVSDEAATEFGIDKDLLLNMLYAENKFSTDSKPNAAGAVGPAQLMPATWAEWSPRVGAKNIGNPVDNIRVGARYLKWCLEQFKNDPSQVLKALYAYNFGIGYVTAGKEIPLETKIYAYSILHGMGITKAVRNL